MPKMTSPRRSQRLRSGKGAQTSSVTKGKARSVSAVSSVDLDFLETQISEKLTKKLDKTTRTRRKIASSISSGYFTEEQTDEEDSEYEKHLQRSPLDSEYSDIENFTAKRKESYDSRYESGNEDYELNDFVVDDDVSIKSESDATIKAHSPTYNTRRASAITSTLSVISEATRRSKSSTSSRLFFSESEDGIQTLDMMAWLQLGIASDDPEDVGEGVVTEPSAEVVEEISDAVAMFSRRCNRGRPPIRLRLSSFAGKDGEVKEALDRAVDLGLGRKLSLRDGTKLWTIGPKTK
ncbi:unnamed protein product [Periconia digitata]|uniref:Uncharacterized protein n=1 Tax=Periconia digitata TaxID=1303443 RepID=A0A9W4U7Z2_9PLEO|nr:unnamed protein product [Periconia digitata]